MQEILTKIGTNITCPMAIIVKNNCVLLGHRHYTADKWKVISVWTTPGGRCDEGETIEQTLRREVEEEVNITDVNIVDFIGTGPGAKEGDEVPVFYCETKQNFTLMEPEKFSEWRWVPITDYLQGPPWSDMNPTMHKMIAEYFKQKIS